MQPELREGESRLEDLLARGEVESAVFFDAKDFTPEQLDTVRRVYEAGLKHGKQSALAASQEQLEGANQEIASLRRDRDHMDDEVATAVVALAASQERERQLTEALQDDWNHARVHLLEDELAASQERERIKDDVIEAAEDLVRVHRAGGLGVPVWLQALDARLAALDSQTHGGGDAGAEQSKESQSKGGV